MGFWVESTVAQACPHSLKLAAWCRKTVFYIIVTFCNVININLALYVLVSPLVGTTR